MSASAPLIEARSLAIGYAGNMVGSGIDMAAHPGEVLCLLGPNGSGKTTLFKTLLGLLYPLHGEVRIGDQAIASLTRQELARRIAYVPQAHAAHFPFLVVDMATMGRTAHMGLFAKPSRADRACAMTALDQLGIGELADREYTRLSGGQRQLVLIARALAQDAPAIVMDEPTASLDFGNQALVLQHVRHLARRGLAVVLSTHDPDHAFAVGDRVAFLHGGRMIASGPPIDVLTTARLQSVYGISVSIERLTNGQTVCAPDLSGS